jgi:two-component system response regulator (stage 0 sporulation protein F)
MVVDDRMGIRKLLQEVLQSAGYGVITAAGGREAVERISRLAVDLVLLDMKMSGMDGLETLTTLKKIRSDVVVIIMTAYEELEILKEAMRCGASAFISKPFDIEELLQIVSRSLRAASA